MKHIFKRYTDNKGVYYTWFQAMHTRMDIVLCGQDEKHLKLLGIRFQKEIEEIEKIVNRFDPSSELYRINALAHSRCVILSDILFFILQECIDAHKKTLGLFDISINSNYHASNMLDSIVLDKETRSISFLEENTLLDLNGYAKGFVLDRIGDIIRTTQVQDAFVSLGNSSILAIGNHPSGSGWKVNDQDEYNQDITLHNQCYTTSGNLTDNHKHILHPFTNKYVDGKQTLSVITEKGTIGEILSTSLLLADEVATQGILDNYGMDIKQIVCPKSVISK